MSRPVKYGIDYFSIDIDIFDDEKIIPVSAEFGAAGEAVIIRILCSIYRNGYYIECTESFIYKIAKQAAVSHDIVEGVIKGLLKWNFFDNGVYSAYNVISSAGIQKRWKEAVRKRAISVKNLPFWINVSAPETQKKAEETPISAPETPVIQSETPQKKVKESKVKEIKEKSGDYDLNFIDKDFVDIMQRWLRYKKAKRESYVSQVSLEQCFKNLKEISRASPVIAEKIVNKSISNNWSGLFALKQNELKEFENYESGTKTGIHECNSQGTRITTLAN